jgi:hypothetical protein
MKGNGKGVGTADDAEGAKGTRQLPANHASLHQYGEARKTGISETGQIGEIQSRGFPPPITTDNY